VTGASSLLLLGAGILAGIVGTAGGITSLVSYPALLLAGVPALAASIANTIAIVACWPGSALASRPELAGRGRWVGKWGAAAAAGGAAGALLLLSTPPGVFSRVVPFLIATGSIALLLQSRFRAVDVSAVDVSAGGQWFLGTGVVVLSAYNGYFGAGTGIMLLTLTLATTDGRLARANALKNMLVGAASVAATVLFAVVSPVDWPAVIPLAAGLFLGSTIGPRVARRMPASVLRWVVALLGLAFAVRLWLDPA
jgi:hypothetical protein